MKGKTPIIFIIDTTSYMDKSGMINDINRAMSALTEEFTSDMTISVLWYGAECGWTYAYPVQGDKFRWKDLTAAGYGCFGEACIELDRMLSSEYLADTDKTPVLVMISSAIPAGNYEEGFSRLEKNALYDEALRIAVCQRSDTIDMPRMIRFTGDEECIIVVDGLKELGGFLTAAMNTARRI